MKNSNVYFAIAFVATFFLAPLLGGVGGGFFASLTGGAGVGYAQVGINKTGHAPDSSAMLDINADSTTKGGLLIPRVSLDSTTDVTTIASPANALMVYNTNAAMTNGNGAGFYYYSTAAVKWIYVDAAANGPGTAGQVLASQGSGNQPKWLSVGGGIGKGSSALGSAIFTAYEDSLGMFTPHANNCASTEAFVPLFTSCTVGYCIEKNVRAQKYWTDAIRTCLAVGKRLPEPFEWQVGCDNKVALGLVGMGAQWEWASNFAVPMYNGSDRGVGAAGFGSGGCNFAAWDWLGSDPGDRYPNAFRCVH
jgi:hypothetical protein